MGVEFMIRGYAKLEDTKDYFERLQIPNKDVRHNESFYSLPIAIGTHLGDFSDEDSLAFIETMTYGLKNGVNFIDTAINYRGMRSERDIGIVLNKLINEEKSIRREEIIISTKGGQIYGDIALKMPPINYLNNILIPNGILKIEDVNIIENQRFTLKPKFYETSIELSRKNLGLETIDIHYIHNPEVSMYVLGEDIFYKQLKELFEFYEDQVLNGYIRAYGFATWNGLLEDVDSRWYISLEKVVEIARAIGGDNHHFKYVQLPYNKFNQNANTKYNQLVNGKECTTIEAANNLGLTVMISAPLNQCKDVNFSEVSHDELLKFVVETPGVYAAMVGTKTKAHFVSNLKGVL